MPSLRIQISPSPKRLAQVFGEAKDFSDYRPAWRVLLPELARGLEQNIRSRGASLGVAWSPLKADTLRRRGKGPVLVATGKSLRRVSTPRRVKRSLTKGRLAVGPTERYQFVQHFGSAKRGIPPRPYIGWSSEMAAATERVLNAHVKRLLLQLADRISRFEGRGGVL